MTRLEGKIAIITGAARGTGAATAKRFVAEGARVVLVDILDDLGQKVANDLGDSARYAHTDVTCEEDWERAVDYARSEFGRVNVLVNNAAVLQVEALEDTTRDDFIRVVMVNQLGSFLGIRAVLADMKESGAGSIVNISSIDGLEGMNGVVAYASSKWGVRGMTKVAALELGKYGIRVNTVCPGSGSFEMVQPFVEKQIHRFQQARARGEPTPDLGAAVSHNVLNRRTSVEDIAAVILFLASDEAAACTGGDYAVDAGYTAGKIIPGAPGS
jgi:3alpha(or 20beta)-hydroxysteroid dehydrogenase